MPSHPRYSIAAQTLREWLAYDPATGALVWARDVGKRHKAGELAGTLTRSGVVVTLEGRRMMAPYVCWALHHGAWPQQPIHLPAASPRALRAFPPHERSARRMEALEDLRLDSIRPRLPHSFSWRENASTIARHHKEVDQRKRAPNPNRPRNVEWRDGRDGEAGAWVVTHPDFPLIGLARFPQEAKAVAWAKEIVHGKAFVIANPPPTLPGDDARLSSGTAPISLQEAMELLAYEPATGAFYWRDSGDDPARSPEERLKYGDHYQRGSRADVADRKTGTRYINLYSRRYGAHQLAWWFTTRDWPQRKSLRWVNGKKGDNRIENLRLAADDAPKPENWVPVARLPPVDLDTTALPGRPYFTWSKLNELVAWDRTTGRLISRVNGEVLDDSMHTYRGPRPPTRPIQVYLFQRYWSAQSLAFFLLTSRWPPPRSIRWLDGDAGNNSLANLEIRQSAAEAIGYAFPDA